MAAASSGLTVQNIISSYLAGKTVKALLTNGTYVFDKHTHTFRSSVTGEVTGMGYVAGGITLSGVTTQQDVANSRVEIVADDANFGTLTVSGIAQIVVYIDNGSAATDRIIGAHSFTAESPAGENFTYAWYDDDSSAGTKGVIGYFTY